jgi:hypothetical protein
MGVEQLRKASVITLINPRSVKRKSDTDRKYKNSFSLKIEPSEKFVLLGVKSHTRPPLEKFLVPESYRKTV